MLFIKIGYRLVIYFHRWSNFYYYCFTYSVLMLRVLSANRNWYLNFLVHTTKDGFKKLQSTSFSEKVVMHLAKPYVDKGHHLFMDNFYNSVSLSNHLLRRKTKLTGTLRSNTKTVISSKLTKGQSISQRQGSVVVSRWKDSRVVLMITTAHKHEIIPLKNKRSRKDEAN